MLDERCAVLEWQGINDEEQLGPDELYDGCVVGYIGTPKDASFFEESKDERGPKEKISDLLQQMAPHKNVLLSIVEYCRERRSIEDLHSYVATLQEHAHSVYSPSTLCRLLEEAGALEFLDDSNTLNELSQKPSRDDEVSQTKFRHIQATSQDTYYWVSTVYGLEAVSKNDSLQSFSRLIQENENYIPIYKKILTYVSHGDASINAIAGVVDDDPLLMEPRRYAVYFIDQLESCGALVWQKKWKLTELGSKCLSQINELEPLGQKNERRGQ